jgi:hypothetical protein
VTAAERRLLMDALASARRDLDAATSSVAREGHAFAFGYALESFKNAMARIEVVLRFNGDRKNAA